MAPALDLRHLPPDHLGCGQSATAVGVQRQPRTCHHRAALAALAGFGPPQPAAGGKGHTAEGVVDRLDLSADTAMLTHGPVPSLNWPAMTMEFKLASPSLRAGLKPGAKIAFDFVEQAPDTAIRIARAVLGSDHTNAILFGALATLTGIVSPASAEEAIRREFGKGAKGERNLDAFRQARALAESLDTANGAGHG